MRFAVWAALLALFTQPLAARPIDRQALVSRHNVVQTAIDPHAPVMLGNGELGFTADITGLQTFPEQYAPLAPLLTMAQWAWHSFPNPKGFKEEDGLVQVPVPGRGTRPYPWIRDWSELDRNPALSWLRENPHRFALGRIALALRHADGRPARFAELTNPRQTLDLWNGRLTSHFTFDGEPVTVVTQILPGRDAVIVEVSSKLVVTGRLAIDLRYPGVAARFNPDPQDWDRPELHRTEILHRTGDRITLRRTLDDTRYWSSLAAPGGRIEEVGPHRFRVSRAGTERLSLAVSFDRTETAAAPSPQGADRAVARAWHDYWRSGAAIDFSGTVDPRAREIERRIVLSQYLAAINQSGSVPPQEEGLFSNSWNGKFHLEVMPLHFGHFAAWGRRARLDHVMGWYLGNLVYARETAGRHGMPGAWWTKMAGPEGRNSPSTINPFIMWQQPAPIYLAELARRADGGKAALERYGVLVEQTAELLAAWPQRDPVDGLYHLGPPIIPVQENHPPLTTRDPAFELEFFRWGIETAQNWRTMRGLARRPDWDQVIAGLAPALREGGLLAPVASEPGFWAQTMSKACSRDAAESCGNRDHPSFLLPFGLIASDRIAPDEARATLAAVKAHWDLRQTWGWDYPVLAMTAARLGDADAALDWLFADQRNNQWGVTGMTPRVQLDGDVAAGEDGAGMRRMAETYFPSNGSLLLAVALLAQADHGRPLFPRDWTVRAEGFVPIP